MVIWDLKYDFEEAIYVKMDWHQALKKVFVKFKKTKTSKKVDQAMRKNLN